MPCVIGVALIVFPLMLVFVRGQNAVVVWKLATIPPIGLLMVSVGIYLYMNAPVAIRLMTKGVEFPVFNVRIPWRQLEEVDFVYIKDRHTPRRTSLLVFCLTPNGRKKIRHRSLSDSPLSERVSPKPDICVKFDFITIGYDIDSAEDLVRDLCRRKAEVTGEDPDSVPPPAYDTDLELRRLPRRGPVSRQYTHDFCDETVTVSGKPLLWLCNPLRYMGGGVWCPSCGQAWEHNVRWVDSEETIVRFRRRMRRKMPLVIKLLQYLFIPAICGVAAAMTLPVHPNILPKIGAGMWFAIAFLGTNLLVMLSPLAGILPTLAGLTYHRYQ